MSNTLTPDEPRLVAVFILSRFKALRLASSLAVARLFAAGLVDGAALRGDAPDEIAVYVLPEDEDALQREQKAEEREAAKTAKPEPVDMASTSRFPPHLETLRFRGLRPRT